MVNSCLQGFSITFFILLSIGLIFNGFYLNFIQQQIALHTVGKAYPDWLFWASLSLIDGSLALYFLLAKDKYSKGFASAIIIVLIIAEYLLVSFFYIKLFGLEDREPDFVSSGYFYFLYVQFMALLNVAYIDLIEKSGKGKYNLPVFGALKSYLYILAPVSLFLLALTIICIYIALIVAACLCYCMGCECSTHDNFDYKKTFWGDYDD